MIKVKVKRLSDNIFTHSAFWDTQNEADSWIEKQVTKGSWGRLERTIPSSDATPDEIASALEVIPAVTEVIPAQETVNDLGEVVIIPEQTIEVSPEMVRLPKTYEIIIEDISAEIQEEKNKDNEKKALKLLLKDIKDAELSTVAELRKAFKNLLKVIL